jgi:hypothetical protein
MKSVAATVFTLVSAAPALAHTAAIPHAHDSAAVWWTLGAMIVAGCVYALNALKALLRRSVAAKS